MFETYAFLVEAIFLALYMTTWGKVSPMLHWFFGIMTALGANASAFVITSVNACGNKPTGFDLVDGKFENVNVVGAMFSQTSFVQFIHSMPAYYFAASTAVVALYAAKLLRKKYKERNLARYKFDWEIIRRLMIFATIMLVALFITADITGKYLAEHEPSKLAAVELTYKTESGVPLIVGGVASGDDSISGPHIKIPNGLSLLAGNSPDAEVIRLDQFPKSETRLYIHTLFDIKMTLITFLAIAFPAYFAMRKWRPNWLKQSWALAIMAVAGWFGIVLVELGWMIAEIGRQPWAVRGYVKTSASAY